MLASSVSGYHKRAGTFSIGMHRIIRSSDVVHTLFTQVQPVAAPGTEAKGMAPFSHSRLLLLHRLSGSGAFLLPTRPIQSVK